MLECFFVYPVRGIEQGSAPQRTKNSPVDCFLARGRFPRVSPETLQLVLEWFFRVSRARNRTRRCAGAFVRDNGTLCFWLYPLHENTPRAFRVFSLSTLGVAYQRSTGLHIFYFACLLAAWRLGRGMEHTMAMPRARATATFKVSMPLLVHRARSLRKK